MTLKAQFLAGYQGEGGQQTRRKNHLFVSGMLLLQLRPDQTAPSHHLAMAGVEAEAVTTMKAIVKNSAFFIHFLHPGCINFRLN